MRPSAPVTKSRNAGVAALRWSLGVFGLCLLIASFAGRVHALPPSAATPLPTPTPTPKLPERGPTWNDLTPQQKGALRPLEHDWPGIEPGHKSKWLELSQQFPGMAPYERDRVQARMAEWARLTPEQRGKARLQFKQAQQVSPDNRKAQWEAYQALPAENKRQLAAKAATAASSGSAGNAQKVMLGERAIRSAAQKSNIVANPALAAPPKAVAPTVVQAQPGATTTLMSKRPAPPPHQQTGLPKIAGSANFVDKATLLPQRGAQGAAITSADVAAPVPRP